MVRPISILHASLQPDLHLGKFYLIIKVDLFNEAVDALVKGGAFLLKKWTIFTSGEFFRTPIG